MSTNFNLFQINVFCCSRRRHSNHGITELETASDPDTASDTSSEFEIVQPVYPVFSRARLRWIRAILAAALRQRIVKAFNSLTRITKRNKAIGAPDAAASRLWSSTGRWLNSHKL